MAKIRNIKLDLIDFTGEKSLFDSSKTLYDDELKFDNDIPELVKNCVVIQEFLFKNPVIPLVGKFNKNKKTGDRIFSIHDCKNKWHWLGGSFININLTDNKPEDIDRLKKVIIKLNDKNVMTTYYQGIRAGGSLVKMLTRSEAYIEKYVDISGKSRISHVIGSNIKHGIGYIMAVSFVITLCVLAPEIAIPALGVVAKAL